MKKPNLRIGKSIITLLVLSTSMMSLTGVTFAAQVTNNAPPSVTIQGVTWYQVSTAAQLEYIDQNQSAYLNANIELMNDIYIGAYPWTPFGTFSTNYSGVFNGQNHFVSGITVNDPLIDFVGFFGVTSGTIENVNVIDNLRGGSIIGGLVGSQNGGKITNCSTDGSVSGAVNGPVYGGGDAVGGLVGTQYEGSITDSYSSESVYGSNTVGGLVGQQIKSSITNSYAVGLVTGSSPAGGLVGQQVNSSITNSYFDTTTTGQSLGVGTGSQSGVTAEIDTAMKTEATFSSWDFSKTWGIYSAFNQGYPYLLNDFNSKGAGGGVVGQMPEVPLAGVLPLLGLAGVGAFWLRRRQSVK